MPNNPTRFTHAVTSVGPAQGMLFTGRQRLGESATNNQDVPLIIAVHGGGYTSAYFDVPGYSLLDRAAALEIPIIAIDRPSYGGSNPVSADDSVFLANAAVIDHLITELWTANTTRSAGIVLIGHSFGGVVVMAIAARKPDWPLLGIAISGLLVREPSDFADIWASLPDLTFDVPAEQKTALMFGPEWTRGVHMPEASYFANVPVLKAELVEISGSWEKKLFHYLAPNVSVPTHLRQGEFDNLWITDDGQLAEFTAALTSAPLVDAQLVPGAGHAVDYHRGGGALQVQQLAFALDRAARRVSESAATSG